MQTAPRAVSGEDHGTAVRTFLIADIRGYSTFTRERGHAEAAKLAAKFVDLAGDAIEAQGGRIVEIRGDEVLAVFGSPLSAVRAGVELQLACAEESARDPELAVPAGVGIDTGESVRSGEQYHGSALNMAARLCARAGTGEVLVTRAVAETCSGDAGLSLDARGTAEFKGFDAPVEVTAVSATRGVALPVPSATEEPSPLPPNLDPPTPMVDRDRELHWLRGTWRAVRRGGGRIMFVSGPTQIGKTRLAAALARQVQDLGGRVDYAGPGGTAAADALASLRAVMEVHEPALLVLDDLDATGETAVGALSQAAGAISGRPTMVLCLAQDPDRVPELARLMANVDGNGNAHRALAPLALEGVQEIARLYAGGDLATVPVESVVRASGGVPGRVHEVMSEWARQETSRRLTAAAEYLAAAQTRRSADLEFANNVIGLKLGRLFAVEETNRSVQPGLCPYKGLASFEGADSAYFFGRERLVGELAARTVQFGLLGVVGDSGSGKSSVMAAGLLPSLRAGLLPGSDRWQHLTMRPGEHPMAELLRACRILAPDAGTDAFEQAIRSLGDQGRLVLFVDQFEEVFTTCRDEDERSSFIDVVASAAARSPDRFLVIVALRGDFFGQCGGYPALAELLTANTALIGPMTAEDLHRAIELPARRSGLRVESTLVEALTAEAANEPGALPLLSTALVELWDSRSDGWMRYDAYERTGGVRGAVARLAEGTYEQLSPDEREAARRIFMRLVGPGEGEAITRRRADMTEFDLDKDEAAARVLSRLTADRLVTTGALTVEVAHEALLREWPRLRDWINEDVQGQQLRQHLTDAARHWEASGREPSELYRGARLSATIDWSGAYGEDLNVLEREFVRQSRQAGELETKRIRRTNRRLRGLLAGAAIFLVVAMVAGSVAFVQRSKARGAAAAARKSALQAQHSATVALSQSLGAKAVAEPQLDRALLLAIQGTRLDASEEAQGDLLTTLAREPTASAIFRVGEPGTQAGGVVVSPDGKTLAVTTSRNELLFFDVLTNKQIGSLVPHVYGGSDGGLAFTPDGAAVILRDADYKPTLIDMRTRSMVRQPDLPDTQGLTLSANGRVVYGQTPEGLRRASTSTGRSLSDIAVPGFHAIPAVAQDTGDVLTLRSEGTAFDAIHHEWLEVRDGTSLAVERSFPVSAPNFNTLAISPDGRIGVVTTGQVCTSCGQTAEVKAVQFIDLRTGAVRIGAGALGGWVAVFSADGKTLATDDGNELLLWDVSTATVRERLSGHAGGITSAAFDPDGSTLYVASGDGTVIAYDRSQTHGFQRSFVTGSGNNSGVETFPWFSISPDGKILAATQRDGVVNLIEFSSGRILESFRAITKGQAEYVEFSPDGRDLAVIGEEGGVALWRVQPGPPALVRTFEGLSTKLEQSDEGTFTPTNSVTFSPDGQWVAGMVSRSTQHAQTADGEGTVIQWNVATGDQRGQPLHFTSTTGAFGNIAFSPSGSLLAVPFESSIEVVDADSFEVRRTLTTGSDGVLWVSFSPDGSYLVAGEDSGFVDLWSVADWSRVARTDTRTGAVGSATFSPNARQLLVTSAFGGQTTLWSVPTLRQIGPTLETGLTDADGYAVSRFAEGVSSIVLVYAGGKAFIWPGSLSGWQETACEIANRNLTKDEWRTFIQRLDRPYQKTCPDL